MLLLCLSYKLKLLGLMVNHYGLEDSLPRGLMSEYPVISVKL